MPHDTRDESLMRRALGLARRAWGITHPNPMVGSLLVEEGEVVSEGWHARDGGPHAERVALKSLGRRPRDGASLYVTLEPCSTEGRTGACTEAILAAGIKRVVVGATDPNPAHAGRGLALLREAGVEVVSGVLGRECTDLNLIFNHWISRKTPLFAGKVAMTLDGKTACRSGESQWITNELARQDVMRWRRLFPAIAVGAGTIAKDDPRLTSRREGLPEWCPWRFVFDGVLSTVNDQSMPALYTDAFREKTIVVTTSHAGDGYLRKLHALGVKTWAFKSANHRVPVDAFRKRCAEEGITGVYFEGGAKLFGLLLRGSHLDYLFSYTAPILLADEKAKAGFSGLRTGRLADAIRLEDVRHESFGDDHLMRGRVVYPETMDIEDGSSRA
jgi:diaminohydroxyphosphoribosylaminopyrimidine deaminase/5-amino-6-(5-phosphoribosylamino)uracil reductase